MKLAQGEYVAVEKIENMYAASTLIQQLYIHGDSLQDYLIGVLVPDPIIFAKLVSKVRGKQVAPEDANALSTAARDPKVVKVALDAINKEARKAGLKG
jgi:long-chain acyl-CoA synthetase